MQIKKNLSEAEANTYGVDERINRDIRRAVIEDIVFRNRRMLRTLKREKIPVAVPIVGSSRIPIVNATDDSKSSSCYELEEEHDEMFDCDPFNKGLQEVQRPRSYHRRMFDTDFAVVTPAVPGPPGLNEALKLISEKYMVRSRVSSGSQPLVSTLAPLSSLIRSKGVQNISAQFKKKEVNKDIILYRVKNFEDPIRITDY